jgi:hypothetical protein
VLARIDRRRPGVELVLEVKLVDEPPSGLEVGFGAGGMFEIGCGVDDPAIRAPFIACSAATS